MYTVYDTFDIATELLLSIKRGRRRERERERGREKEREGREREPVEGRWMEGWR